MQPTEAEMAAFRALLIGIVQRMATKSSNPPATKGSIFSIARKNLGDEAEGAAGQVLDELRSAIKIHG